MNIDSHSKKSTQNLTRALDFSCVGEEQETDLKSPLIDFHNEISFLHFFWLVLIASSPLAPVDSVSIYIFFFFSSSTLFIIQPERSRAPKNWSWFIQARVFFYDEGEREAWRSVRNSQKKWFHIISGCCEWAEWMNWWSLNFGFSPGPEREKSVWKFFSGKREREKRFNGKIIVHRLKNTQQVVLLPISLCAFFFCGARSTQCYTHFRNKFSFNVRESKEKRLYRAIGGRVVKRGNEISSSNSPTNIIFFDNSTLNVKVQNVLKHELPQRASSACHCALPNTTIVVVAWTLVEWNEEKLMECRSPNTHNADKPKLSLATESMWNRWPRYRSGRAASHSFRFGSGCRRRSASSQDRWKVILNSNRASVAGFAFVWH